MSEDTPTRKIVDQKTYFLTIYSATMKSPEMTHNLCSIRKTPFDGRKLRLKESSTKRNTIDVFPVPMDRTPHRMGTLLSK